VNNNHAISIKLGISMGARNPKKFTAPVGPCIAGIIDMRGESSNVVDGYVIQEGVCPAALAPVYWLQVKTLARVIGSNAPMSIAQSLRKVLRGCQSLVLGPYSGSVANSQTFLIMGYDDQQGHLSMDEDRLRITFRNAGRVTKVQELNSVLETFAHSVGGTFVPSPLWGSAVMEQTMLSVHPVGGCVIGSNANKGVINHKGQVGDPFFFDESYFYLKRIWVNYCFVFVFIKLNV
jgi:cholesterol oxidase